MTTLDEGDDGRSVDLAKGQEFEIVLAENPTTGHRWRIESLGSPVCALIVDTYQPPEPAAPGRAGTHRWRFRCEREGEGAVALTLGRTWEKATPASGAFRVGVRVPKG
jgi:predicted secreted protein